MSGRAWFERDTIDIFWSSWELRFSVVYAFVTNELRASSLDLWLIFSVVVLFLGFFYGLTIDLCGIPIFFPTDVCACEKNVTQGHSVRIKLF